MQKKAYLLASLENTNILYYLHFFIEIEYFI